MIHFTCQQCGKVHERPDAAAGSLVFCECGQGNRVPWESSAAGAERPPDVVREPLPEAVPLERDEDTSRDRGGRLDWDDARPAWDPSRCFNHEEAAATRTCEECGVGFCEDCVVSLQGQTLCGPCKNLRVRRRQKPLRVSALAIISLVVGLMSGVGAFCLVSMGAGAGQPGFGFVGLVPPLVALVLSLVALQRIEKDPNLGGRALATTALMTGLVGTVMAGILVVIMLHTLG